MTVIWIVIEIMVLFMFYQLPSAVEPMIVENSSGGASRTTTVSTQTTGGDEDEKSRAELLVTLKPKPTDSNKKVLAKSAVRLSSNAGEASPLLRDSKKTPNYSINRAGAEAGSGGRTNKPPTGKAYVKYVVSRMFQEEIIVLLFVLFITIFTQLVLEVCGYTSWYIQRNPSLRTPLK